MGLNLNQQREGPMTLGQQRVIATLFHKQSLNLDIDSTNSLSDFTSDLHTTNIRERSSKSVHDKLGYFVCHVL